MVDYLNLDGDGEEQSHGKEDAEGEQLPFANVDGKQPPMGVSYGKENIKIGIMTFSGCDGEQPSSDAAGKHCPMDVSHRKEHPVGSTAQEGRQQGGHRLRLPRVLMEGADC
jgi:hypothetical protein